MERFDPTHLIVHGPMRGLIRWGTKRGLRVGCVFADSFHVNPLVRWLRYGWLARVLNDPAVSLVANHGRNAARGLVDLGVRADKVIAWDFPHIRTPDQFPVKAGRGGRACDLFYVGSIEPKKGVGDLIEAVARLNLDRDVRLRIAGSGQVERFRRMAEQHGVADRVEFLGIVPNSEVPALMQAADAVVVPSRHTFSEGLPLTLYEALASRTPTIASDHPMFVGHLTNGQSALVFPAGDSAALAGRIAALLDDPELYARVSRGSQSAWRKMQVPVKWGAMIDSWMRDTPGDRQWLTDQVLAHADSPPRGRPEHRP